MTRRRPILHAVLLLLCALLPAAPGRAALHADEPSPPTPADPLFYIWAQPPTSHPLWRHPNVRVMAIASIKDPAQNQLYTDPSGKRVLGWDERTGRFRSGLWYHEQPDYRANTEKYVARVMADIIELQRLTRGRGRFDQGNADGMFYFFGLGQRDWGEHQTLFGHEADAVGSGSQRLRGPFHEAGIRATARHATRLAEALRDELRLRGLVRPAVFLQDNEEWLGWPVWSALLMENGRQTGWWEDALSDPRAEDWPLVRRGDRWLTLKDVVREDGYLPDGVPIWNINARYNHASNLAWRVKFEGLAIEISSWTMERAWGEPFRRVFPGVRVGNYGIYTAANPQRGVLRLATSSADWPELALGRVTVASGADDFSSPELYRSPEQRALVFPDLTEEGAHLKMIRDAVADMQASPDAKPIVPWVLAPGNGSPKMTERLFVLQCVALLDAGLSEIVVWGEPKDPAGFDFDQILALVDALAGWARDGGGAAPPAPPGPPDRPETPAPPGP